MQLLLHRIQAYDLLGRGLSEEGRLNEAEASLEAAHLNLAVARVQQKHFDEANLHLREVLRIDPGIAAAWRLIESMPRN